jgi:hypothetical protein
MLYFKPGLLFQFNDLKILKKLVKFTLEKKSKKFPIYLSKKWLKKYRGKKIALDINLRIIRTNKSKKGDT